MTHCPSITQALRILYLNSNWAWDKKRLDKEQHCCFLLGFTPIARERRPTSHFPIRRSTNFMTLIPSLTFTDYAWFPWSICNGCGMPAGNAYPSGHLVPSPIVGLACAPIVETRFLELAMSLLDFSPRIPLGTFSTMLPLTWTTNVTISISISQTFRLCNIPSSPAYVV